MEQNPYQAPAAIVTDVVGESGEAFYVVAPRKLLVMQIGTGGLYSIYWFYRQWKAQNTQAGRNYWPIPRAIFSIFFCHSLFGEIRRASEQRGGAAPFAATLFASIFVGATLTSIVIAQFGEAGIGAVVTQLLSLSTILPTTWALYRAQLAANHACDDVDGEANASLSAANVVWIVIGALLWLFNLFLLYTVLTVVPLGD